MTGIKARETPQGQPLLVDHPPSCNQRKVCEIKIVARVWAASLLGFFFWTGKTIVESASSRLPPSLKGPKRLGFPPSLTHSPLLMAPQLRVLPEGHDARPARRRQRLLALLGQQIVRHVS
jgi:hypothetical protein